jgi:hypothetical protein
MPQRNLLRVYLDATMPQARFLSPCLRFGTALRRLHLFIINRLASRLFSTPRAALLRDHIVVRRSGVIAISGPLVRI